MGLVIQGNLLALNASNNTKINTGSKAKSAERLSSGLRINRAADDAAGLSISEKMRKQIRGLDQGARNAQDGVSFAQTGDGSLNEVDAMIHRMEELSIKAANGTLSASDRADIQAEFRQLQKAIDQTTDNSIFNETHVFSEHAPTFHSIDGNKIWDQGQTHVIDDENDSLTFTIQKDADSPEQTFTVTVKPHGNYTTAELNSAIDDALLSSGAADAGIEVVYKMDGSFDISYEGGEKLKSVDGGLSYLLYDMYSGASTGALIGTTIFTSDDARLSIRSGLNDNLSFDVIDFSGNKVTKNITLPYGYYNRQEIMDMLNDELSDTTVTAVAKGTGIKLQTNDAYITRFKGNMFDIEEQDPKYTSVFYDNVKHGSINPKSAVFTGGAVLNTSGAPLQKAYSVYHITSENNTLSIKPDNGDTTYTVTIPNGEYTASEMASKLNELFAAQGSTVSVSSYQTDNFSGLKLTSKARGVFSDVGVIATSSAYNTLFVEKNLLQGSPTQNTVKDTSADRAATFTGGNRTISASVPLVIQDGVNDQFKLMDGTTPYTIKLSAGTYDSPSAVAAEINNRIADFSGINGRVSATVYNSAVRLISPSSSNMIASLKASPADDNTGYKDIFVGVNRTSARTTSEGSGRVITAASVDSPVSLSGSDRTFSITVAGQTRSVTFNEGLNSHDDIVSKINSTWTASSGSVDNTFSNVSSTGTSRVTNVTSQTAAGAQNTVQTTYSDTGSFTSMQGSTASDINIPASVTVNRALIPQHTEITYDNDQLGIKLNGTSRILTLDTGLYSQSELVSHIQAKLDAAFEGMAGTGATVGIKDGYLTFTSKLDRHTTGDMTSISLSSTSSSFMKELHTTYTPGTSTSTTKLLSEIRIDDSTKDFTFTLNGTQRKVELPAGTYSTSQFIDRLNSLTTPLGAAASTNASGMLVLTTTKKGSGNTVSYNSGTGSNTSADRLFGPRTAETSASVVAGRDLQPQITIASPGTVLRLSVDGESKAVDLRPGTYTSRASFVNMVNQCFADQGINASASLNGNRIKYESKTKGTGSQISISYDSSSDSAMKSMYGTTVTNTPAVTASFDSQNRLVLSSPGNYLLVTSDRGSVFQKPRISETSINPTEVSGYKSTITAYAEGNKSISFPVTIDRYNNNLVAQYSTPSGSGSLNIPVDTGVYNTIDELVSAIRDKVNSTSAPLDVSVSSNGANIRLSARGTGSQYSVRFNDSNSTFFYSVMNNAVTNTQAQAVRDQKGSAPVDSAYVVGRKDIRHRNTVIEKNTNDELTLDMTIKGSTTTLTMKLQEGSYSGNALVSMIQEALDKTLVDNGFEAGFVKAAIGAKNTGVEGANDANALDFILNPNARFNTAKEENGSYVLDGVGGSAAFSVFYQTDGEMIKAYTTGVRNISGGVDITDESNELSFSVDGIPYDITIPSGKYSADDIKNTLQELMEDAGAPVNVRIQDNKLKIEHKNFGKHMISGLKGSARSELFFREFKAKKPNNDISLQMSSESMDIEELTRHRVDTAAIKINGCCLTTVENARKTIGRLDTALHRVSDVRSYLGAKQNRLEHAININKNTSENTTAAESGIRDADMALEVLQHSRSAILEQVSEAMLSQSNKNPEMILGLLK